MEPDRIKEAADHALMCLRELRGVDPVKALTNLRLIREFAGEISVDDPMERANAWWEICQLCSLLSGDPQSPAIDDRWENTLKATEAWCATLSDVRSA
jgi:hypothetical protein